LDNGNVPRSDDDTVVLADSAAVGRKFAFLLVFGGIGCVAYGAKRGLTSLEWTGATVFAAAALVWSYGLWRRKSLVLNPTGLCVLRRRRIVEMIAADAVREVILTESASGSLELRLNYDLDAAPVLPPAVKKFTERWGGATPAGTIVLGRVSSDPAALTLRKAFRVHRLVEDAGIGEWRRISEP
jgi:hypothetical protein